MLGRYTVLRLSRLLPLLVAACLICWLCEMVMLGSQHRPQVWTGGIDGAHLVWNMFGAGGFFGTLGSLAPSYTISYELLYYALWGVTRSLMRDRPVGQMAAVNLAGAFGTIALLHFGVLRLPPIAADIVKELILVIYVPWLIGAYLADSIERIAANRWMTRLAPFAWLILLATIVVGWRAFKQPQNTVTMTSIAFYVVLALAFGLLLVRGFQRSAEPVPRRFDQALGLLSYPLYLIHGPMIVFAGFLINAAGWRLPFGIYLALLLAAALAVAWLLVHLVEKPVLQLRRAWLGATARPSPPADTSATATPQTAG